MLQAGPLQLPAKASTRRSSRCSTPAHVGLQPDCWQPFTRQACRRRIPHAAAGGSSSGGSSSSYPSNWWQDLNERHIAGPVPPDAGPRIRTDEEGLVERMGERQYKRYIKMMQQDNQQQWDYYRALAMERYSKGEMPHWFDPRWLDIEEAPPNTWWRQQGLRPLQVDATWLGDGGGGSGGGGGGGGGGSGGGGSGWWREEDPYWPLRNWGEHPMRWWTWGFAALLAAGGWWSYACSGSSESLWWGCSAAASLAFAAMAMSDMTDDNIFGHLGVKLAWATCVLVAAKEYYQGWRHQSNRYWLMPRQPHLENTGWAAAAMAALYMLTGMSGLSHIALPTNPGEAFKWTDVAAKHLVWEHWGYSNATMR